MVGDREFNTSNSETHLSLLEAEAIEILREVVSEAENPVMLYSVGQGQCGNAASGKKGFLPFIPSVSIDACGYDLEIPGDV